MNPQPATKSAKRAQDRRLNAPPASLGATGRSPATLAHATEDNTTTGATRSAHVSIKFLINILTYLIKLFYFMLYYNFYF